VIELLVLGLATWRVTNIIHEEKIAEPLRKLVGFDGVGFPDTFIGYLFSCFKCLSVWVAGFLFLIWQITPAIPTIFALSALAVVLWETIYGNR